MLARTKIVSIREIDVHSRLVFGNRVSEAAIDHRRVLSRGKSGRMPMTMIDINDEDAAPAAVGSINTKSKTEQRGGDLCVGSAGMYAGVNNRCTCPFNLLRGPTHR